MKKIITGFLFLFILMASLPLEALWDNGHKNSTRDALLYMNDHGTNQQRWVIDYLKAKCGGFEEGDTFGAYEGDGKTEGTEAGLMGIARAGAIAPDYAHDLFWDSGLLGFSWSALGNNYSSFTHFMNFNKRSDPGYNDGGHPLVTWNHNDFDGWSYQGNVGFDQFGSLDYTIAVGIGNANMTVDLPNCSECSGKYTFVPGGNPAIDYKQNGATTPVGSPSAGGKRTDYDNGTNYNCFSDTANVGNCPDRGDDYGGTTQVPNTYPGGGWTGTGDQDWAIFEPMDNCATFYYNEWFLEGGASTSGENRHSLQPETLGGRYYSISSEDIRYLAMVLHYAGDANAQVHIHSTTGYNHSDYEEWIDNNYSGLFNVSKVQAYMNGRSNTCDGDVDDILTENGFYTYLGRYRDSYDILYNTSTDIWRNAAVYAINHTVVSTVILLEKGVLDLRKNR